MKEIVLAKLRVVHPLVMILLLGLALRLLYWSQLVVSPLFYGMVCDSDQLHECALLILRGEASPRLQFLSPVYPYFLAAFYAVFGVSQAAAAAFQLLLDGVSVILVYAVAARVFGRSVALVAAAFYAACGTAVLYAGLLLETTLVVVCVLLAAWLILLFREKERPLFPFLAGMVFAVAAFARPNAALMLPFLPVLFITQWDRRRLLHGIGCGALFLAGCLPIFLPLAWRNYRDYGAFSPFSVQGGINFYIGNNQNSDGAFKNPSGVSRIPCQQISSSVALAAKEAGHPMTARQASSYWLMRGGVFLAENPGKAMRLYAKKIALLLRGEEQPLNMCPRFCQSLVPVLRMPLITFGFLTPLALFGIVAALVHKRDVLTILLFPALYGASVVLFFVSSRYRMPLVPFAAVFAAYGLMTIIDQIRRHDLRRAAVCLACVAVAAALVNVRMAAFDHACPSVFDRRNLALAYMRMELNDEAIQQLTMIAGVGIVDPVVYVNLTALLAAQKRYGEAEAYGVAAERMFPTNVLLLGNLAAAYKGQGKHDQAKECYQRVLRLDPTSAPALNGLANEFFCGGEYADAIACWERLLAISPDRSDVAEMITKARVLLPPDSPPPSRKP